MCSSPKSESVYVIKDIITYTHDKQKPPGWGRLVSSAAGGSAVGFGEARLGGLPLHSQPRQSGGPEREGLCYRVSELHREHSHGTGADREGQRYSEKQLLHDDPLSAGLRVPC
jgi:hypothetical protein